MVDAEKDESSRPAGGINMNLPPPRKQEAAPSIPEGQKPAEEVKLVGKPLIFRPLSVGMNAKKKKKTTTPSAAPSSNGTVVPAPAQPPAEPPKKKVSLFSLHTEEASDEAPSSSNTAYEPLFESGYADPAPYADYAQDQTAPGTSANPESLDTIANDLNLSAAARRELFGRDGGNFTAKKVVNFNMDKEYQHNESVRASGEQQSHKAVRSIQGGGKHSLRQLVQNVQNQREALEDSFATAKSNKKATSSKYGW
jgi:hypothetical protein